MVICRNPCLTNLIWNSDLNGLEEKREDEEAWTGFRRSKYLLYQYLWLVLDKYRYDENGIPHITTGKKSSRGRVWGGAAVEDTEACPIQHR